LTASSPEKFLPRPTEGQIGQLFRTAKLMLGRALHSLGRGRRGNSFSHAVQLARVVTTNRRENPLSLPLAAVLVRNAAFLSVVLAHGFRRLLPPLLSRDLALSIRVRRTSDASRANSIARVRRLPLKNQVKCARGPMIHVPGLSKNRKLSPD
jgi:hypothetical protein